ncbi:hypothetical protein GCM10022198_15850 [Klugiella xanthotipulae]|uniref:Uncharacterized protein n=1 Tax=Klugiella xanthotipulae TaxID=244735 RepID=A0A543HH16_9MICO|nr:hypothetical protein [Klugiella xanthotipulae]TQM57622.1 hypothetical protein FB466_2617 [Klugiella xanthotipulae]
MNSPDDFFSDLAALNARVETSLGEIKLMLSQVVDEASRSAERDAAHDEARAIAARRGDLGPEWRKIQHRLDLNQTSVRDIFSGTDDSTEAQALRATSQQRIAALREDLVQQVEASGEETDPLVDIQNLNSQLYARLDDIRDQLGK